MEIKEQSSSVPYRPSHPNSRSGAEQVYQIVIEQPATFENRAKKAINNSAEKAGKNDRGNLIYRHKPG